MGKDAANTLFTENQEQQVAPEQFKAGISSEMNKGSGLELRQPEGDKFHGDMLKPDMSAQYNSTSRPAQLMQDPTTGTAGGFHGDPMLGSQTFTGEPRMGEQFKDSHLTNRMGDEFPAGQLNQGAFNEAMILKPHSSSLSSNLPLAQSGKMETFSATSFDDRGAMSSDHHHSDMGATHIHDGRHAGMLPDGRTVNQSALLHDTMHDDTMRDATIHDGRSRPLVPEAADSVPLAERVVAGVHAGDPLSRKGKFTSVFKKDQHKGSEFEKEGIIKGDHDLIPHEHLKKSEPLLAEDHLSSGPMLTRQQNNFEAHEPLLDMHQKDAHMNKDAHLKDVHVLQPALQSALGPREHAVETFSATGLTSSDSHAFNKDSHLMSKDLDKSHLTRDSDKTLLSRDSNTSADLNAQGKGAKLKEKLHIKKEKLKEKLHMKKDGSKKDELGESHAHTEARANPKGHEIATIKIPGIESGDRAAQEMVNHQAKAKKELNAELKEHVHSDHIAPSEIHGVGHGMSQMSLHENRAVDSGADDGLLKDNILAKQAVNAEIKDHAGMGFGLQHREMPADQFQREGLHREMPADQFQREGLQAKQAVNAEIMDHAGTGFGLQHREILPTGQFQQGDLQAKQAVNAEIKEHAGTGFGLHHLEIAPTDFSKDQFQREDLSQRHDQFHSKDFFQKDSDILSKDSQKKDFVPSTDKDDIEISDFQRRALHKNKAHDHAEIQPSMTQTVKDKVATAATAVKDTVNNMALQDKIATATTAVKDTVNNMALQDKVTTAATTVKDTVGSMALQDKVATAATAVKDTVGNMGSTISNMMPSSNSSAPINEHAPMGVMDLKDDVNAEIRALGATHPDHVMPSDISTMHTSAAPAAAGLASYIPEKVTHAATALKDTLGNKISSMMPSSQAPASAPVDFEEKDAILAKDEVNAEIRALGATTSDNIMPSDISTMHTSAAPAAAGLASYIPEKVTHAAVALKDTLGNKISSMMPSSHASASAPAPRDVMEDLEKKDIVLAKNEVNTEIKALGATSSDNIMPSDISTMHTSAAPAAAGLASYIPEKVTHAATALKDTLGNKISSMMPSSQAPASAPVDLEQKDAILAKDEVNAEIRSLGATSSDNIMPSDISTMHTSAAPAAGLASYIPEKVTHAATALKDTLGNKISSMMPSSQAPANVDLEPKDPILAKDEVNAEIRALGAASSDIIMPSEISSMHTTAAPAAGLASYTEKVTHLIPEKVTHAAVALKDTLGSKISGFLPSSSTVPASHEVVIADLAEKTEAVEAKNEINAEIRELGSGLGSGNIMPSEISSSSTAANAGTTIIHDGRSEIPDITDANRLKSEMDYQQAHDDSAPRGSEDSHLSMRQMIQEKVTNAAMAVKETLHF